MNNDQIDQLIQGIGIMTDLWVITYQNFKNHGMNDTDAVNNTKALMSVMVDSVINNKTWRTSDDCS